MGGSVAKQFLEIGGKPVVVYALEVFEHSPEIDQIILVTGADKIECGSLSGRIPETLRK